MENITWILWTVLGVILIIAEVFTPGFVLLWFGVGALAAALASFLGAGLPAQFVLFIALSSVLTALSRTIFAGYFSRHGEPEEGLKVGASALPGKANSTAVDHVKYLRNALEKPAVQARAKQADEDEQKLPDKKLWSSAVAISWANRWQCCC